MKDFAMRVLFTSTPQYGHFHPLVPFARAMAEAEHEISFATPAALFLLQAINHATEHRAQIATTLTQLGIEPPVLDGWAFTAAGS